MAKQATTKGFHLKKIILLLLFTFSVLQAANDSFDTFIDEQIAVEKKLLDQNITQEKIKKILKQQDSDYQQFFFDFATDKKNYETYKNPYRNIISQLKLHMNYNKNRGYTLASMRDKIQLQQYLLRSGIRNFLHKMLKETRNHSKEYFEDKVNDMISEAFAKYTPLEKKKYIEAIEKKPDSPLAVQLENELQKLGYMESLTNTFSSKLIEHSGEIYNAAKIANSKFFALINNINQYPIIKSLNSYLSFVHLDTAMVLIFIFLALLISLVNFLIGFITERILRHHNIGEEDIDHIHSSIIKLVYYITTVMIIHLALVFYFGIDTKSITISKFFAVIYIFMIALLLHRITNALAYFRMERLEKSLVLKKEVFNLLIKIIHFVIILAAIIAILIVFGVDLTALLSGLGIGGFAVAFAAKDSIANVFGSISILLADLFEQGDWIEADGIDGTVVEIGLRATTLRTFDNALISVPNFKLANGDIKNWSRRLIGRRIKMKIGVTYESDFDDIRQAIKEIRDMLKEHIGIAGSGTKYQNKYRSSKLVSVEDFKGIKRTSLVYMDEFADSSINILIYCFSKSVVWNEWLEVKEDVMFKIAEILKKNHLEFAYPALTIHQASDEENRESSISDGNTLDIPRT